MSSVLLRKVGAQEDLQLISELENAYQPNIRRQPVVCVPPPRITGSGRSFRRQQVTDEYEEFDSPVPSRHRRSTMMEMTEEEKNNEIINMTHVRLRDLYQQEANIRFKLLDLHPKKDRQKIEKLNQQTERIGQEVDDILMDLGVQIPMSREERVEKSKTKKKKKEEKNFLQKAWDWCRKKILGAWKAIKKFFKRHSTEILSAVGVITIVLMNRNRPTPFPGPEFPIPIP